MHNAVGYTCTVTACREHMVMPHRRRSDSESAPEPAEHLDPAPDATPLPLWFLRRSRGAPGLHCPPATRPLTQPAVRFGSGLVQGLGLGFKTSHATSCQVRVAEGSCLPELPPTQHQPFPAPTLTLNPSLTIQVTSTRCGPAPRCRNSTVRFRVACPYPHPNPYP